MININLLTYVIDFINLSPNYTLNVADAGESQLRTTETRLFSDIIFYLYYQPR